MSFKDIIGQKKAISILLESLKRGKIFSSYIFLGKEGVGRKLTALELAKAVNCLKLSDNFETCEKCLSCYKINKGCSPDLQLIEPLKGVITIGQIRELQREVNLKPLESKRKIYIIEQAEKMTAEASNSLLKTIEEPPPYALIILICSNLEAILPTIISRCQLLKFGLINTPTLRKALALSKVNLKEDKIELISKLAQGSIGKALKLVSDKEYFVRREKIFDFLIHLSPGKSDGYSFARLGEVIKKNNDNIEEVLEIILFWYRDIFLAKERVQEYTVNIDKLGIIKEKSEVYSREELRDILDYLTQIPEFLDRKVNKQLILENLYLKMAGVEYCLQ